MPPASHPGTASRHVPQTTWDGRFRRSEASRTVIREPQPDIWDYPLARQRKRGISHPGATTYVDNSEFTLSS